MKKEELVEEINSMIDDEMNIINLQRDDFDDSVLKTLWNVKKLILELE